MSHKITKKQTVNKGALCMSQPLEPVFTGTDADKPEEMTMLAYSGSVIPNHFFWGNLAIDTKGIEFPKKTYPILEDHETEKKIGFSDSPIVKDNALHMDNIVLLDTKEANEFIHNSKKGFPYQASIYAIPTDIEEIEEDASTEVNGYTFKGPGTIWRKCTLRESSVCTFGYDTHTESKAFAENDEVDLEYQFKITHNSKLKDGEPKWSTYLTTENRKALPDSAFADMKNRKYPHHWISDGVMYLHRGGLAAARSRAAQQSAGSIIQAHLKAHAKAVGMGTEEKIKKETKLMDFDIIKFAEAKPEEYSKFVESATKEAIDKLSAKHTETLDTLSAELTDAKEKLTASEEKILSFEKEAAIQEQAAMTASADTIWATKLSESDLPENLHEKVKLHVSYEKFVSDKGLDTETFSAAIDEEVADWTEKGITSTVLGSGFSQKKVDDADEASKLTKKDDDACVEAMLNLI